MYSDEEIHKANKEIAEIKGELAKRVIEAKSRPKPKARMIAAVSVSDDDEDEENARKAEADAVAEKEAADEDRRLAAERLQQERVRREAAEDALVKANLPDRYLNHKEAALRKAAELKAEYTQLQETRQQQRINLAIQEIKDFEQEEQNRREDAATAAAEE